MAGDDLDADRVAALQRSHSGLDDELNYIEGHTIHDEYAAYKAADRAAGEASTVYRKKSQNLKAQKPYDESLKRSRAGGSTYYEAGHRELEPLAGTASDAAQFHAESRESFNERYKDVLDAKGGNVLDTHLGAANDARASQNKYRKLQKEHQKGAGMDGKEEEDE